MMKRLTAALLALLLVGSLAACGKPKAKELDLAVFSKQVIDAIEYDDDMILLSEQIAQEYYDLKFDGLEGYVAYGSGTAATTNELLLLKLKDDAAITSAKETVQARIDTQTANYESYRPDEVFRLENALIEVQGNYLLFSISPDNDKAKQLFTDALK